MESTDTRTAEIARRELRATGTFGLVIAVSVAVILGVHPWGSTDLYDDGVRFTEHVSWFWIAIHFVGALLILGIPVVIGAWGRTVHSPAGHLFGRLAGTISVGGVALAALHLVGTDTTTFLTYEETLQSGRAGADVGADVLLRLHAATLMAFTLTLFLAVPLAGVLAASAERDRTWRFWLPLAIAGLTTASVCVTLAERQWTTLSEMGLFRPAVTLFLLWLGLLSLDLRRAAVAPGAPAGTVRGADAGDGLARRRPEQSGTTA